MPTNRTPRSFQALAVRSHTGASRLQCVHHGAQKSRTTALPRASARRKVVPLNNSSAKSGAALGADTAGASATSATAHATANVQWIPMPRLLEERRTPELRSAAPDASTPL